MALNAADGYPGLGVDGVELLENFDTLLWALARMRSGEWKLDGERDRETLSEIQTAISAVVHRLALRVDGIAKALVRDLIEAGGSYAELARSMDTARSTAQSRAQKIVSSAPDTWEDWATGEGQRRGQELMSQFTEELDRTLPEGLVIRWGQPTVREILTPAPILVRGESNVAFPTEETWDPRTAVGYWLPSAEIGDPHTTPVLFLAADGTWVLRDDWSRTWGVRPPGMRFWKLTKGEALRFLEEAGHYVDVKQYFPEMTD